MNLTTVAAVKTYLAITTSNQDALIAALIPRESKLIEAFTGRNFEGGTYTQRLNGSGTSRLTLPVDPVISVSALTIGSTPFTQSSDGVAAGFYFDDVCVYLTSGAKIPEGYRNVLCTWTAGYAEEFDAFVPTGNAPTITPYNSGTAVTDRGVVYAANGSALTQVGTAPAEGQYSFANGTYTFNQSDFNREVTMSYFYVPSPIEQACIEMVGIDLKQRDNLGINSKTLAGETISYSDRGMSNSVKEFLNTYRKRVPL